MSTSLQPMWFPRHAPISTKQHGRRDSTTLLSLFTRSTRNTRRHHTRHALTLYGQWALGEASSAALAHFKAVGVPLVMGSDLGPYNAGPLWIYNPLK
mmetsp:Transcript_7528/g.18086  ORF Transcript_7528/g.18086 Transcript_7528/m.18086 type:complete len:97 (+) Transcript_7528:711-1001(+)